MKLIQKKTIPFLLAVLMIVPMLAFSSFAANTVTSTVDISITRQAVKGDGYYWSQTNHTMTLDGLRIETEDDYGLRLPNNDLSSNITLVLNGDNYISAKEIALTSIGSLTVTGSGTLTLVADRCGLRMDSPEYNTSLVFAGGKIKILAKETGIESKCSAVTLGNADIEVSLSADNALSMNAYSVQCNSGSFKANAPIASQFGFSVGTTALDITAKTAAVTAGSFKFGSTCKISAGNDASSLSSVSEYAGQSCLKVTAPKSQKTSVILCDICGMKNVPVIWDYILLASAVLLLACVIVIPILNHRRKTKKKIAEVEAARAERLEAKRAANREKKKNR